jgi:membrane protein DedA with SNARE-associated domain
MDFTALVDTVGYPAVALGTFLEGETVLMAAGFAANRGYLQLSLVMLVAALAGFASDQMFFWLGRLAGPGLTRRWPTLKSGIARVQPMIERHPVKLVIGVRFMVGFRTVGPIALGMTPALPALQFVGLNLIAAALWAAIGASTGYFFGRALGLLIGDAQQYQSAVLLALAGMAALAWSIRSRVRRSLAIRPHWQR